MDFTDVPNDVLLTLAIGFGQQLSAMNEFPDDIEVVYFKDLIEVLNEISKRADDAN